MTDDVRSELDLDALREGWDFEAKLAAGRDGRGAVPESAWETYAAMANTEGGVIVLGVAERADGTFDARGITDIDKVERDFWNTIANPQKVSANLLRRDHVRRAEIDGRALLVIEVPKAMRQDRPVHLDGSWERNTFVRVHDGDRRVSREIARRMIADASPTRDAEAVDGYSVEDLHRESVRRYRAAFGAKRPGHPFIDADDEDFLLRIGALVGQRPRGRVVPSLAGLLFFGEERALRELYPHWHLSYRELPSDPGDSRRWLDRVHPDGTWNANVHEFYFRAIRKLHDFLKVPFELEGGQFRVDETPVHVAIREALVNALIHADYQGPAGIRVARSRSGFEFVNPGLLLVTPEQIWRGGVSESRNPALQRLFGFILLGEREGSGGPTMRRVWAEQHWRAPRLWEDVEHGETHLELRQESLLLESAVAFFVATLGPEFARLDELARVLLVTARAEGSVSHARARELSDAHPRDITLKFQELTRRGLLVSSGRSHGTTYSVASAPSSGDGEAAGAQMTAQRTAQRTTQSLERPAGESIESHRGELGTLVTDVANTKWSDAGAVRAAILAFCRDEYRSVAEVAAELGRSERTILQNYVRPLLDQGAIEPRYPGHRRHPQQAYRTTRTGRV